MRAAEAISAGDAGASEAQADASWEKLPAEQCLAATASVDIYLDDFIFVVQGGPTETCPIIRHLFSQIDKAFRPNETTNTNQKEQIYLRS